MPRSGRGFLEDYQEEIENGSDNYLHGAFA